MAKSPADHARGAQKMREEKTLKRLAREQGKKKWEREAAKAQPKAQKADAWPKDRPKPVSKKVTVDHYDRLAKESAPKAAKRPPARFDTANRVRDLAKSPGTMKAAKTAGRVASRAAGPVAAAGAAGAAVGSAIYNRNATAIQDGLEKIATRRKKAASKGKSQ